MSDSSGSNSSQSCSGYSTSICTNSENEDNSYDSFDTCYRRRYCQLNSSSCPSHSSYSEESKNYDNGMNNNNENCTNETSNMESNHEVDEEPIEMLEENNNDPNNNMDNENSETSDASATAVFEREGPTSPMSSYSKYTDVIESNSNNTDDINDIAKQILKLISKITHESIVSAINNSKIQGNAKQISLLDLLPESQLELKHSLISSKNMKKFTVDKSLLSQHPPSSPINAGSFISKVNINILPVGDNSHDCKSPEIILNKFNEDRVNLELSPISRQQVIYTMLDVSTEKPSTSNGIYDSQYSKPVVHLPQPQSHQRKVYIRQYSNNNDINDDNNSKEKYDSEIYKHSNSTEEILVDEYCDIERHKERKIPNKAVYHNNYVHQTSHINTIKSTQHSNIPVTIKINGDCEKVPDSQYANIQELQVKKKSNLPAAVTKTVTSTNHHYHQDELEKNRKQTKFDRRTQLNWFGTSLMEHDKDFRMKFKPNSNFMRDDQKEKFKEAPLAHQVVQYLKKVNNKVETLQRQVGKKLVESDVNLSEQLLHENNRREMKKKVGMSANYVLPAFSIYRHLGRVVQEGQQPVGPKDRNYPLQLKHGIRNLVNVKGDNDGHTSASPLQFRDDRSPARPGPSQHKATADASVCLEIYHKLHTIFPKLKPAYIKKFCPSHWAIGVDHDVQLSNIIDMIFCDEQSWDYDNNAIDEILDDDDDDDDVVYTGSKSDVPNVEETCDYLAGIFPNADPHYLRDAAIKFQDENSVKTFVDEQLTKPNYPTREQYLAKLKITEEQMRYTTNFVIADFIKIFPDPFGYFEDPKRKCRYDIVGSEFLKATHNRIRVHTISKIYAEYNYNISLATKQLKLYNDEIKSRRNARPIPTADIPMLQEMAFIRHQDVIREYIDEIQSKERIEFKMLKAQNKLLMCQCCYDDECMPSKCSTCENGHNFCNSCVITGTNSKLGEDVAHIPCFLACGSEFSLATLQKILLPTKFSILLKKRQAAEVMAAGLEGLVSCPFCHFASIPPEGDKVFKCLNPECMKESCIQCKEPNHVPLRCHEVMQNDKARKYIEEKMTQALAHNCYKCKRAFFKEEGCNKITCPCGAIMCYLCDKPIEDYSHFAGQGSDDKIKCPLWTDNQRLNAETVRKVAENARSELLRQDPTLVINTDGLAPELPPPTQGPHNHIIGAQNIAVQLAARVMRQNRQ